MLHRARLALLAAILVPVGLGTAVAEKASPVEPSKWLNSKTPIDWKKLQGRVILVEKWATW